MANENDASLQKIPALVEETTDQLKEIFQKLGVKNLKDALHAIKGLQERVRYTESFESLKLRLDEIGETAKGSVTQAATSQKVEEFKYPAASG